MAQDAGQLRPEEPRAKIFISYSRKDMAFADRLEAALKMRGFEVLIDREAIYAFELWWERIQALIGRADTVVFVLSPNAVKSDVALKEVTYAASLNKRFAPIVCSRVEQSVVPEALRRLNFIFFDDPGHFEDGVNQLAEALQVNIGWIRKHSEFGETAHRWIDAGQPNGMLLRPPVLDQAEAWLSFAPRGAPVPTWETKAFIAGSRKAVLRNQRLWRLALGTTFTLMAVSILGLLSWVYQASIADQWRWWTVTRPYAASQIWPHVLAVAAEQALKPKQSFKECRQDCPEMVVLPDGTFRMGGPVPAEQPLHMVTIGKPFAISKYEITFADWDACVTGGGCSNYSPSDQGIGRGQQPVYNVNWADAKQYVSWLSQITGKTYRLLSEAEYEYARATTAGAFPWGNVKTGTVMADCLRCGSQWDNKQPAPVGSFPANDFGLYDAVGNLWTWTEDCAHDNYNGAPTDGSAWINDSDCMNRIIRGGSWHDDMNLLGARTWAPTFDRSNILGFRVARTLNK